MSHHAAGDRTNLPTTLRRARKAAKFSNAKDFLAAVKASGRKAPSYSTYAQWESGEVTPRDETLDPIIEYHREAKTWPDEAPESDLTSAIRELTRELQAAREERARVAQELERIQAVLDVLAPQAMRDAAGPAVPDGSAGSGR